MARREGRARERRATLDLATIEYDATLRQASSEVRAWTESVSQARLVLAARRRAAAFADRALDLATAAYDAGATTNIEVIDAERRARDAATATAVAEDGYSEACLELLVAAGRFPDGDALDDAREPPRTQGTSWMIQGRRE